MLNARALSQMLAQNTDKRLCKTWFLMTTTGSLLASSTTTSSRQLRKQVSVVALSWQNHQKSSDNGSERDNAGDGLGSITTLTIESDTANLIATSIQHNLILVLEGGVPPRRRGFDAKVTAERPSDEPYPVIGEGDASLPSSPHSSAANSVSSTVALSVLRYQREKLNTMAEAITADLESTGFQLPGVSSTSIS